LVKEMFNHQSFRHEVQLSGVNSINWARIMAQIVYYFSTAVSLGAPEQKVSFCVPTGNFGDIFAGYVAKLMGLPIDTLIIATNDNDILARTLASGIYEKRGVVKTTSPSMDIQISSNFERLLFEAHDRDALAVRNAMESLKQQGSFSIDDEALGKIRKAFGASRCDVTQVAAEIANTKSESGYLLDPHTATAANVGRKLGREGVPMVVLGTAHPAKFPDAVKAASGQYPALPTWLGDLMERDEHYVPLPNDLKIVESHILKNTRAA
ncbi:MAG: threonine synthase, partial [Pseudomonadota bacterium]